MRFAGAGWPAAVSPQGRCTLFELPSRLQLPVETEFHLGEVQVPASVTAQQFGHGEDQMAYWRAQSVHTARNRQQPVLHGAQ